MRQISIPMTPVAKPRMVRSDKWNVRPAVKRYRDYCDELHKQLPGYQLPGRLHLRFFLPMPQSWSRKQRMATLGAPHEGKPDIDNLAKAFMDAFKSDDSHVFELHADKYWGPGGFIEVEVDDDQLVVDAIEHQSTAEEQDAVPF